MQKTVLTFSLIGGGIIAALMTASMLLQARLGFDYGMLIGYTTMVLAFMMVYFGIRSYRDTEQAGVITYGRAFQVGILIALVISVVYVVTWLIIFYGGLLGDFCDRYAAHLAENAHNSGMSAEKVQEQVSMIQSMKSWSPLKMAAMTFIEPLPVALLFTAISAWILRRKPSAATA